MSVDNTLDLTHRLDKAVDASDLMTAWNLMAEARDALRSLHGQLIDACSPFADILPCGHVSHNEDGTRGQIPGEFNWEPCDWYDGDQIRGWNTRCGDWPAPCNCDDPTTHNGHNNYKDDDPFPTGGGE